MNNREQIWKIVADFSTLTKQANSAARALRKLEAEREQAGKNNSELASRYDREADSMGKLSKVLQDTAKARRELTQAATRENEAISRNSRSISTNTAAHKNLKDSVASATHHREQHRAAIHRSTNATEKNTSSTLNNSAALAHNNNVVASSSSHQRLYAGSVKDSAGQNSRLARNAASTSKSLTQQSRSTSVLSRLLDDIVPKSRSWALVMKMIPLTAATSAVNSMAPAIAGLGGAFVGLAGSIGPVIGLLGALPTMGTAVAGSFGGILSGVAGIFGAMKKYNASQDEISKNARKRTANEGKDNKGRIKSLRSAEKSVRSAQRSQQKAAQGIADAQERYGEVVKGNADKAAQAEKTVQNALRDSKKATEEVSKARTDAAARLEDYKNKLKNAALDEEATALDLESARAKLARTILDPGSTSFEKRSADLAVRQAEQRMSEVREDSNNLNKEAADARKKGIEGSDAVVAAKENEARAQEAIRDAQKDLADTYDDNNKALRDAKRAISDAREAYQEAGLSVAEAKENLEDLKNQTDATSGSTAAATAKTDEYKEALAKLHPAARLVVEELITLSKAWEDVTRRSQGAISPGLLSFLKTLRISLLPSISDFLVKMAGGTGDWLESLARVLSKEKNVENLNLMFKDSYDFMVLLGRATNNLIEWLLGMGAAAEQSGLTRWIGEVIESWTSGWKNLVDDPLGIDNMADSMERSMDSTKRWGTAIKNTWGFLRTLLRGFKDLGDDTVEAIGRVTKGWDTFLKSEDGRKKLQTWKELAKVNLSGLSKMIATIARQGERMFGKLDAKAFQRVWDAINGDGKETGLINALGKLLGLVNEDMLVSIVTMGTSIADILRILGDAGAMRGVLAMVDVFKNLSEVIAQTMRTIPGFAQVVAVLIGLLSAKKILVAVGQLSGLTKAVTDWHIATKAPGNNAKNYLLQTFGFGNFLEQPPTAAAAAPATPSASTASKYGPKGTNNLTGKTNITLPGQSLLNTFPIQSQIDGMGKLEKAAGAYRGAVNRIKTAWAGVGTAMKGTLILAAIGAVLAIVDNLSDRMVTAKNTASGVSSAVVADINKVSKAGGSLNEIFGGFDFSLSSMGTAGQHFNGLSGALKLVKADSESLLPWLNWINNPAYSKQLDQLKENLSNFDNTLSSLSFRDASEQFKQFYNAAKAENWSDEEIVAKMGNFATSVRDAASASQVKIDNDKDLADAMRGVHPEQDKINAAMERGVDPTGRLSEKQEDLSTKMGNTADNIEKQKDKIKDWREEVRKALGQTADLEELKDRVSEQVNSITEVISGDGDKTLTGTSSSALKNRGMFRDLADGINDTIIKMQEMKVPASEIQKYIDEQTTSMGNNLKAFDRGGESVKAYIEKLGILPATITTNVLVETPELSLPQIAELNNLLLGYPPNIASEIIMTAQRSGYKEAMEMKAELDKDITIGVRFNSGEKEIVTKDEKGNSTQVYFPNSGLTQKAEGGPIEGPGTETSDSIPALLSRKEYVIKAKSAKRIGYRTLDHINKFGSIPGFAKGGRVKGYATGGAVGGGSGLSGFFSSMASIGSAFTNLGVGVSNWGTGYSAWWSSLWSALSGIVATRTSQIIVSTANLLVGVRNTMGSSWSALWASASGTVANNTQAMVIGVASRIPAMSVAWNGLMNTMKAPIKDGVNYINNTLGSMVSQLGAFYGVKTSPFPLKVPGFDGGGWTGPGSRLQPAGVVHADEFVIRKSSRQKIEKTAPGLLDHMNRTGSPGYAGGGRVRPASGGESGNYAGHSGIDYRVGIGTPVHAADSGIISSTIRKTTSYGLHIVQQLAGGLRAIYAHLSAFRVVPGQKVNAGQVIGLSGSSGNSTGPHLHFEVVPNGGSAGRAGNRDYTRSWLGGAAASSASDAASVGAAAAAGTSPSPSADAVKSVLGRATAGLADFKAANASPWGEVLSGVLSNVTNMVSSKVGANPGDTDSIQHGALVGSGITTGDSKRVSYGGGMFTSKFAAVLQAAERMAGVKFRITQGGFRPSSSISGTSHMGDAVDIGSPTSAILKALRANGVAAWLRGAAEGFRPHIHGVPLPGYGFGGGSAIWQAQDYLKGGDGLGSRGKRKGYARGGWTGPGDRNAPAGIVHADEFVVKKKSRRNIERLAPGLLDYINNTGNLPGYAGGGLVSSLSLPKLLNAAKTEPKSKGNKTRSYPDGVLTLENALNRLGLLLKRYVDGHFGSTTITALAKWQKKIGLKGTAVNGLPDTKSIAALGKKYGFSVASTTPKATPAKTVAAKAAKTSTAKASGPTLATIIQNVEASNRRMTEYMGLLGKIKAWGHTNVFDTMKALGPDAIPEEFRDAVKPKNGLMLARELAANFANSRRYEEALKAAAKFDSKGNNNADAKMDELLSLLQYGLDSPYSLVSVSKELGVSVDTAARLFKRLDSSGALKNIAVNRTSRIRGDVIDFDRMFKFNKGGIVPGFGDRDTVPAMLTPGELVVPKDVVNSLFVSQRVPASALAAPSVRNINSRGNSTSNDNTSTYTFNTNVYNPVGETSATTIRSRIKSVATRGLLRP